MQKPQVELTQCRGLRGVAASRGIGGSRQGEVWSHSSDINLNTAIIRDQMQDAAPLWRAGHWSETSRIQACE